VIRQVRRRRRDRDERFPHEFQRGALSQARRDL